MINYVVRCKSACTMGRPHDFVDIKAEFGLMVEKSEPLS